MTPDGIASDLDRHRAAGAGPPRRPLAAVPAPGRPVAPPREAPDDSAERMRRIRALLHHAYVELLQAHTATVAILSRLGPDREHMGDVLAEARRLHEAMFLVRRAVDALVAPVRPIGS